MAEPTPWRLYRTQQGTVLDHADKISIAGNPFKNAAHEYWVLVCLWEGMETLYHQALEFDDVAGKQPFHACHEHTDQRRISRFDVGGNCGPDQVPETLLTCLFHWYAVSAVQYVRTVGAIAYEYDSSRQYPQEYAEKVIPEVCLFHDKVATYFAWDKQDDDDERLVSPLSPLCFQNGTFYVGNTRVALRGHGKIKPWSLCKVHEALRERYWPGKKRDE